MKVSAFVTPLRVEKIEARRWRLLEPLVYISARFDGVFVAPTGFETNFASVPRPLWVLLPPVDKYDPAAVIHDAGYSHALLTEDDQRIHLIKPFCDAMFYEALGVCGINDIQAWVMWKMVSAFGDQKKAQAVRSAKQLSFGASTWQFA